MNVKLFILGCWRKITIDDFFPFDEDNNLLLPTTTYEFELWPMLLSKAIIKLANVDPGYVDRVWELLKEILPEFKLAEDHSSESKIAVIDNKLKEPGKEMKDNKEVKDGKEVKDMKDFKPESSLTALKAPEKSDKNVKGSSAIQSPHMVVYATFTPLYLFENKIFTLEKMANSAEKLREYGLSHICSHPVLVTRSRSCPLVAPPKPPPLPPWKLIRQKKEKVITDEAQDTVPKKPEQFLEISSPFLNYRMTPFTIPTETHFVQSVVKKGTPLGSSLPQLVENELSASTSQGEMSTVTGNQSQFSEERVPYYLFVDSLKPIELLVCFSALVRWGESGALTKDSPHVEPGLLTAEAITWKSLKPLSAILRIHTYATKAAMVRLPVGRHMLLFSAYSPVGHAIHVCSMVTFVIGDEDVVLPNFEPESYRFTEQSLTIMKAIGNVITSFKDKAEWVDLKYTMPINEKEYSPEEIAAAVKIQSMWKGTYVRMLMKARMPGMVLRSLKWSGMYGNGCLIVCMKKGYTFVAEAYTSDAYVSGARWKLRLIGSDNPLPFLSRDTPCSTFILKEIKDYYIPNDKKILFRYSIKVTVAQFITIQVRTSKPDAFIKLQVLESEETMCYKYIIQCLVMFNSWPLTESQLIFVQALKELEKIDIKEKHEELTTVGSPDFHATSEGQKSVGVSKTTRKGKEKAAEKEKLAKEKQAPRFEPQASQARLKYLNQFIKKPSDVANQETLSATQSQTKTSDEVLHTRSQTVLEISPQLIRKALEFVDFSHYVRKTSDEPVLQTEELNKQQAMQKAEEIHQFRQYRSRILSFRDIDQEERFKLKDEVLDTYGEMRDSVDEARQKIFDVREEYRNKLLEAERLRLEALAAQEAALKAETEKKSPASDSQKKKKGKKK
ncbi:androglobin [Cricetulus griseus]